MKNSMIIAATAAALLTSNLSATVLYTLGGDAGSFTYLAPSYIASSVNVPASDLTTCSTAGGVSCGKAIFSFPDDNSSIAIIYLYDSNNSGVGTIFSRADFGTDGVYTGLYVPTRTLTVTTLPTTTGAVPEPASWAMMIAGFGIVGAAMRRRKAAVSFA